MPLLNVSQLGPSSCEKKYKDTDLIQELMTKTYTSLKY